MSSKKEKGISLLEKVIENLENSKFSLFSSIQKLNRIGNLLNEEKLVVWTEIQLGNSDYTSDLKKWILYYFKNDEEGTKESEKELKEITEKLEKLGIVLGSVISNDELSVKANKSGGGFLNIGFIEEKYNDIVKTKRGNDNTYYKTNLSATLSVVKAEAYKKLLFIRKSMHMNIYQN